MFDKFLSNPQWAQVAVGSLVALFTLGALIAVAASARIQMRDRADREALELPEVETYTYPLGLRANAYRVKVTIRNFGITPIELQSLEVNRQWIAL